MSVKAVAMFYGQLGSNMMMRKEFAQATSACIIKFAAERGHLFTEYDLLVAGGYLQGMAKTMGDHVKQVQAYTQNLSPSGSQESKNAHQPGFMGGPPGINPGQIMSHMQTQQILSRIGEIFGAASGSKKKG
jgi:hypothetical protein